MAPRVVKVGFDPGDVSDPALVPRRLDLLTQIVADGFDRLEALFARRLNEAERRVDNLEHQADHADARFDRIEIHLGLPPLPARSRAKPTPRKKR